MVGHARSSHTCQSSHDGKLTRPELHVKSWVMVSPELLARTSRSSPPPWLEGSRPKPVITSSPGARAGDPDAESTPQGFVPGPNQPAPRAAQGVGASSLLHARQGAAAMSQDRSQPLPETTVPHREAGSRSGRSPGSSWVWHSRASTFVIPGWLGTTAIPARSLSIPRRVERGARLVRPGRDGARS